MAAFEEQEYTKSFDLKIWQRLGPVLSTYKKAFVGMFAFNAVAAVIDVVLPLFQRYAVQHFIGGQTLDGIWPFGFAYLAAILISALSVVAFGNNSMRPPDQPPNNPWYEF